MEPKYIILKKQIIESILKGDFKIDEMLTSENQLAERYKISRHTVRQTMAELVNEGYIYKKQGKGTFIADSSNRKDTSLKVGIMGTYEDYIFPSIINGVEKVLAPEGYNILLFNTGGKVDKEAMLLQNILNLNLDGLIVEPTKSALPNPNILFYKEILKKKIPLIFINGCYPDLKTYCVHVDDFLAGYMATKHLIDLGHKNIAAIFKVDDIQGHERYKGYLKALRESGLAINENAVIWYSREEEDTILDQEKDVCNLSRIANSSAIIAYNDKISLELVNLLKRNNIQVPEDISIVSFDDSTLAVITEVKLTSITHPKEGLGVRTANLLLKIKSEQKIPLDDVTVPELIVRSSSKNII
ncbi:MAG TPA: GntR family transcriptional regulator [Clostridiaceae bacterium]